MDEDLDRDLNLIYSKIDRIKTLIRSTTKFENNDMKAPDQSVKS